MATCLSTAAQSQPQTIEDKQRRQRTCRTTCSRQLMTRRTSMDNEVDQQREPVDRAPPEMSECCERATTYLVS
jgi:hypothetical protein